MKICYINGRKMSSSTRLLKPVKKDRVPLHIFMERTTFTPLSKRKEKKIRARLFSS